MKRLPIPFSFGRYGISVRLVEITDAQYIISLRTNEELSQHLHCTSGDLEKQIKWIEHYKEREQSGQEYYFLYEINGNPIGVNRLYDISDNIGVTGSAICPKTNSPIDTLATIVLLYDIVFEEIGLDFVSFATDNDNVHALRVNNALGAVVISENEKEKIFKLEKDDYFEIRKKLIRIWRLKV